MFWSVVTTSGRPVDSLCFFLASHTEPYSSKHFTTHLICRSEGKFRPWNLASRRLNALLTVVMELVSYHFFKTKILSSTSIIIENDQKRTKWVTNRNYLGWSKFTFRHRNVKQTVFVFRTTIIGYIILLRGMRNPVCTLQQVLGQLAACNYCALILAACCLPIRISIMTFIWLKIERKLAKNYSKI